MFGFPRLQVLVSEHAEEERSLQETLLEELYSLYLDFGRSQCGQ
jgi:hypothetical protein